jgi:hypothetical protein
MKIKKNHLKILIEKYIFEEKPKKDKDDPVTILNDEVLQKEKPVEAYNYYALEWGIANPDVKHKVPSKIIKYLEETLLYSKVDPEKTLTYKDFLDLHARNITIKTDSKKIDNKKL